MFFCNPEIRGEAIVDKGQEVRCEGLGLADFQNGVVFLPEGLSTDGWTRVLGIRWVEPFRASYQQRHSETVSDLWSVLRGKPVTIRISAKRVDGGGNGRSCETNERTDLLDFFFSEEETEFADDWKLRQIIKKENLLCFGAFMA